MYGLNDYINCTPLYACAYSLPDPCSNDRYGGEVFCLLPEKSLYVFNAKTKEYELVKECKHFWKVYCFKQNGTYYTDEDIELPVKSVSDLIEEINKGNLYSQYKDMYKIFVPLNGIEDYPFMIFPSTKGGN